MGVRDGSNRLNSKRITDVCVTDVKCFSEFCLFLLLFDDKSPDKQEIN